jgi:hypothetical protein
MILTAPTQRRELAQRANDGIEVTLFWRKDTNGITVEVLDLRTGARIEFDVDGGSALDAFNHPYAYAAARTVRDGAHSMSA